MKIDFHIYVILILSLIIFRGCHKPHQPTTTGANQQRIENRPDCPYYCGKSRLNANGLSVVSELSLGNTLAFASWGEDSTVTICEREQLLNIAFDRIGFEPVLVRINWTKHLLKVNRNFYISNATSLTYLPKYNVAIITYNEGQPFTDFVGPVLLVFNLTTGKWVEIEQQKCIHCHDQLPHFNSDSSRFVIPEGIFYVQDMLFSKHSNPQIAKLFSRFLSDSIYIVWHNSGGIENRPLLEIIKLPNRVVATHNAPINLGMGLGLCIGYDSQIVSDNFLIISNVKILHPNEPVENSDPCGYYLFSINFSEYYYWIPCESTQSIVREALPLEVKAVYKNIIYLEPLTLKLFVVTN